MPLKEGSTLLAGDRDWEVVRIMRGMGFGRKLLLIMLFEVDWSLVGGWGEVGGDVKSS